MQVAVLNGVNLDVLGDRDPELYGGLSLGELETRIYALGARARLHGALLPDEPRGASSSSGATTRAGGRRA